MMGREEKEIEQSDVSVKEVKSKRNIVISTTGLFMEYHSSI